MGYSVSDRITILQRDLSAFERRVARVVDDAPERTPSEAGSRVQPLFATAAQLRERAVSIAGQMGRPDFFDQPLRDADRGTAMVLDAAYNAGRYVAMQTGVGATAHAALTVAGSVAGSEGAAAVWTQLAGSNNLPNVRMHGASNAPDLQRVIDRIAHVPRAAIEATDRLGTRVTLFDGKLTDVHGYRSLRGRHPRGWPPGATWDSVPGAGGERGAAVRVSSEERGHDHGSTSLVLHEYGHVIDHAFASWTERSASSSAAFRNGPWQQMRSRLAPTSYLRDHPEEWFAESFARYTKSPHSAAALKRWYPSTWTWFREHLGEQQFG